MTADTPHPTKHVDRVANIVRSRAGGSAARTVPEQIDALYAAEIERLQAALEPFAGITIPTEYPDTWHAHIGPNLHPLTVGDIRRAAQALSDDGPTSDIVERLQAKVSYDELLEDMSNMTNAERLCDDAANEIVRLRAESADRLRTLGIYMDHVGERAAEIVRLQALNEAKDALIHALKAKV